MDSQEPITRIYAKPQVGEYHDYYHKYIDRVSAQSLPNLLKQQPAKLAALLRQLDESESLRLHEPYTWSFRQVMGHLIDCERVFAMRLLRLGAQDPVPIPGINQEAYVAAQNYNDVELKSLLSEFRWLRKANIRLAERLSEASLTFVGTASDQATSARACLYTLVGHVDYHLEIITQRLDC